MWKYECGDDICNVRDGVCVFLLNLYMKENLSLKEVMRL